MPDAISSDLAKTLSDLLAAGDVETATVTVVLRAKPPSPPDPDTLPVCHFTIGPVSSKE
jgi:hypothetical protein